MVQISKNISIEGFDTKEELDEWLKEQEKKEPNENVLKMFKWFLIKIENANKNEKANFRDCDNLDLYANKVIERKLMTIDNVIKYIGQAISDK